MRISSRIFATKLTSVQPTPVAAVLRSTPTTYNGDKDDDDDRYVRESIILLMVSVDRYPYAPCYLSSSLIGIVDKNCVYFFMYVYVFCD